MRSTSAAGSLQAGHLLSLSAGLLMIASAHSMQKRLWPQGTNAATTSASSHTLHRRGVGEPWDPDVSLKEQLLLVGLELPLGNPFICPVNKFDSPMVPEKEPNDEQLKCPP